MMTTSLVRCILLSVLLMSAGYADTYQPKIDLGPWAKRVKIQPGAKFAGKRLWGSEIVGQDLTGASFDDCNLQGVALRQCKLQKATFRRAILDGFCLDDCELGDNDFTDAVLNGFMGGFQGFSLTLEQFKSSWSYKNRDLSRCEIRIKSDRNLPLDLDFRGFKLIKTRFYGLDLSQTSFEKASVHEMEMHGCRVSFPQLSKASMRLGDCRFESTEILGDVDLSRRELQQAVLYGPLKLIAIDDAEIWGMKAGPWLTGTALEKTKNFKNGCICFCGFAGTDFSDFDFSGQALLGTSFGNCNLAHANFDDAVISFGSFHSCTNLTVEQIKATWNYRHDRMENVTLPPEIADVLAAEDNR